MKRLLLILTLIATSLTSMAATSAGDVMRRAAETIARGKTASASYVLFDGNSIASRGTIEATPTKFRLVNGDVTTVFDGTTQWTVDASTREITIYDPEEEEVPQNPFSVIYSWDKNFNVRMQSTAEGEYTVRLTPKTSDTNISTIDITINASTWLPTTMNVNVKDGTHLRVVVADINLGANFPSNKFVVNTKSYPGYDIIDLR